MIKEHKWSKIYDNADVEQCLDCPVQRRSDGAGKWQYRESADDLRPWTTSSGTTAPDCSDAGKSWFKKSSRSDDGTWARTGTPDRDRATESLETELKELSDRIATDPMRFQQVADELARRRRVKDEQPPLAVVTIESQRQAEIDIEKSLTLKVIAMESQQAQLVVEAEIAKAAQREAEERLALVVKRIPTKREPMTREAARELADRHKAKDDLNRPPYEWVIDAIVEASK